MYLLVRAHLTKLHRAHQTAIFRIRTHDAPLNAHLHRIKKEHPAKCVYCPDSDETIEHVLFHCPLYDDIRSRLLPAQPIIGVRDGGGRGGSCPPPIRAVCRHEFGQRVDIIRAKANTCLNNPNLGSVTAVNGEKTRI